jgi:Pyruvate/2-oxoacid:ferredoxin oxidoreductase delta subunit
MEITRKIIEIDEELCDGCGNCVPSCAEGALEIVDGKAKLVADIYCDGLGACLGECPTGALTIVEREAEEFDEEAVEEFLSAKAQKEAPQEATMACGCPSTQIQAFAPATSCAEANTPAVQSSAGSALSHWPVQIKLVPPAAPFLKGADLLVAADCTPVAYPNFHEDFLRGRTVMVGCPKFDDVQEYVQKFADIFKTADIKSVTVLVMEVPCCQGLPMIVEKGMEMSGKTVPIEKVVISAQGEILNRQKNAA